MEDVMSNMGGVSAFTSSEDLLQEELEEWEQGDPGETPPTPPPAPPHIADSLPPADARRAQAPDFRAGVERLISIAGAAPTAILCSEEDPRRCHRRLLHRGAS